MVLGFQFAYIQGFDFGKQFVEITANKHPAARDTAKNKSQGFVLPMQYRNVFERCAIKCSTLQMS